MNPLFNPDFKDLFLAFNNHEVEYLLIGGYTVILYGYPRTTGDLDIWLNRTKENYKKVIAACLDFGLPTQILEEDKFLNDGAIEVFTFGRPPVAIDLLVKIKEIDFDDAFKNAVIMKPDGFPVRVVGYFDLVRLKRISSRPKDLDDLNNIKEPSK